MSLTWEGLLTGNNRKTATKWRFVINSLQSSFNNAFVTRRQGFVMAKFSEVEVDICWQMKISLSWISWWRHVERYPWNPPKNDKDMGNKGTSYQTPLIGEESYLKSQRLSPVKPLNIEYAHTTRQPSQTRLFWSSWSTRTKTRPTYHGTHKLQQLLPTPINDLKAIYLGIFR